MNRMRPHPILLLVLSALLVGGPISCKDDSKGDVDPALKDRTATLASDEASLLQRRDALLNSRRTLRDKRKALAAERVRVIERGGDPTEVEKQQEALNAEEAQLGAKENQLEDELGKLLSEQRNVLQNIASKGDNTARIAVREGTVASREKGIASREARVAERERAIAAREAALAKREKETCGVSTIQTVVAAPPPGGTTYRKKDVAPLLQRARKQMSKKGILRSDLPAQAQGLEKEATAAMKKGDYGSAHFAARQLMATVKATSINRSFIQAKFDRLSKRIKRVHPKMKKRPMACSRKPPSIMATASTPRRTSA